MKAGRLKEALERAVEEPSLLDAFVFIAVWECERAIQQARRHFKTGERGPDGQGWDTCFGMLFRNVEKEWQTRRVIPEINAKNDRESAAWKVLNEGAVFPLGPLELQEASPARRERFTKEVMQMRDACNHLLRELGVQS